MVPLITIQRMLYIERIAVVSMTLLTRYSEDSTLNVIIVVEEEYHEWDIYSREEP